MAGVDCLLVCGACPLYITLISEKFPEDTESRWKLGLYAASRASQMRRMRAPRPQVKHGASVE